MRKPNYKANSCIQHFANPYRESRAFWTPPKRQGQKSILALVRDVLEADVKIYVMSEQLTVVIERGEIEKIIGLGGGGIEKLSPINENIGINESRYDVALDGKIITHVHEKFTWIEGQRMFSRVVKSAKGVACLRVYPGDASLIRYSNGVGAWHNGADFFLAYADLQEKDDPEIIERFLRRAPHRVKMVSARVIQVLDPWFEGLSTGDVESIEDILEEVPLP